jgi:hypothetical protein
MEILERFQSKALRMIVDAPLYVRISLSEGISKYKELKKKFATTALDTCSPQWTHKQPICESHGATRQKQAISKTYAKLFSYQIRSVIVVFVLLVFKVQFVSLVPKSRKRPWTY